VTGRLHARLWQNLTVRLAVALAFADASIVVLALPQIVARLHTSISHVTWVIMAYNLALIVTAVAVIPFAGRLDSTRALIAGLALFGLASIGCGLSNSMAALVPFRCVQGVGAGLLLCASLPLFASTARPGDSALNGWAAAAAIGIAVGPAAGGILTQIFDWRAIFLAQAPVAALAVILILVVRPQPANAPLGEEWPDAGKPTPGEELPQLANAAVGAERPQPANAHFGGKVGHRPTNSPEWRQEGWRRTAQERLRGATLDPLTANAALTLLSAGLIAALFLVVLVLIDVWLVSPIGAAAVVTTIPLATALAERRVRGSSPIASGAVGATLVAAGLLVLSLLTHRELGIIIVALALVGTGLGLAFPGLTTAALKTGGTAIAEAAKTVAARDAGIVLGLLVLTPVFVDQLNNAPNQAQPAATKAVLLAPIPLSTKISLAPGLVADYKQEPQSQLPNFTPTFAQASAHATPAERAALQDLHTQLDAIVQRAATNAFKLPLRYGAIFALLVLPLLGFQLLRNRRSYSAQLRR
jgi:MFS family permease